MRTLHIESSLALRIEAGGKSLVYKGDTDYSEALIELLRIADVLLIESTSPTSALKRAVT